MPGIIGVSTIAGFSQYRLDAQPGGVQCMTLRRNWPADFRGCRLARTFIIRNTLMMTLRDCRLWLSLLVLISFADPSRGDVVDYVKTPDAAYSWKLNDKTDFAEGTVYDLHLVSQVWQGITWEHQLQVYLPKDVKPTATMFLWNQGGKSSATSIAFGMDLAKKMNAPVAILFGIPNQPLFEGKKEDA